MKEFNYDINEYMKYFKKKDFDFVNECLKDKFDIALKEQEKQKKIL